MHKRRREYKEIAEVGTPSEWERAINQTECKKKREENRRKICKVRKGGMVPHSKTQGAG